MVKQSTDRDILRQFFDALYTVIGKIITTPWRALSADFRHRLITNWQEANPRVKRILIGQVIALILLVVAAFATTRIAEYVIEMNQPTLVERVSPPFDMMERALPDVDLTQFQLLPLEVGSYTLKEEGEVTHLMGHCILGTELITTTNCNLGANPTYSEYALYAGGNDRELTMITAKFDNVSNARTALRNAHGYAMQIGHIANFNLLSIEPVNFFFSSTRNNFSFTWSHGEYLYTVNGANYSEVLSFVEDFPY